MVKSHHGRNVSAERKVGECFQVKANGQCLRGDPVVLTTVFILVNEHNHHLLLRERRHRLTEESLSNIAI